jgi:hypothetical protein
MGDGGAAAVVRPVRPAVGGFGVLVCKAIWIVVVRMSVMGQANTEAG